MTQREESYDFGVIILKEVRKPVEKLEADQYYALMVTDIENRKTRSQYDYVNFGKGYIGLERTSNNLIYVSKSYLKRNDPERGVTVLARVEEKRRVLELKK